MSRPVILTGLRANNDLHIGHVFGAMYPIIDMAKQHSKQYQINMFIPDLHSFTTPIDHSKLQANILHNLRLFVAAGLPLGDPNVHIYRQSYISAHSELTWILDCFTGMGEMSRMTQFKDKSAKLSEDRISVGLFNYPVLMATDILLYSATYVPVGDDQSQHLEFARDIAERMNTMFKRDLFVIPKPAKEQHEFFGKDQGLRIKDLQDPTKKMSKSDETGKGVIFLTDDPKTARKKIMLATTDSFSRIAYNRAEQPGLANLMDLLALLQGKTISQVSKQYVGQTQYGPLKAAVAEVVEDFLTKFQAKLSKVKDEDIFSKLEVSEATMREQANQVLLRVQRAVGLRPQKVKPEGKRASSVSKPSVISFDDFAKLDIRIGKIVKAKLIENSDKLIELEVDLGTETRNIITGMQQFYKPSDFIGKKLPIIANLKSQNFMGAVSQGMLMAVEGQNGPVLLMPEQDVLAGSPIE